MLPQCLAALLIQISKCTFAKLKTLLFLQVLQENVSDVATDRE
jgi:hypothetical protein